MNIYHFKSANIQLYYAQTWNNANIPWIEMFRKHSTNYETVFRCHNRKPICILKHVSGSHVSAK